MTGPFVPIEEVAKHFTVSVSTIRAWVRQGHIPKNTYIKVGNTYRFAVDDVSVALKNRDAEPVSTVVAVASGAGAVTAVSFDEELTDDDYNLDEDM